MSLEPLHPAVGRALALAARHAPPGYGGAARGAELALRHLLRDRAPATADAWTGSLLGRSGFPVEVAIVFDRPELRYTVEPAGPGVPSAQRLAHAIAAIATLSDAPIAADDAAALAAIQARGALAYGAWLGGRHGGERATYKLYAQVPEDGAADALAWAATRIGDLSGIVRRGARPVMAGWQPHERRAELYFQTRRLFRADLPLLLAAVALERHADALVDLLRDACRSTLEAALPAASFGVSIGASPDGDTTFTLYAIAHDLFGGDARIRDTLLRLASSRGWDAAYYRALTEPLANATGFVTRHGMFGITVAAGQPARVTIGLTPDMPVSAARITQ